MKTSYYELICDVAKRASELSEMALKELRVIYDGMPDFDSLSITKRGSRLRAEMIKSILAQTCWLAIQAYYNQF